MEDQKYLPPKYSYALRDLATDLGIFEKLDNQSVLSGHSSTNVSIKTMSVFNTSIKDGKIPQEALNYSQPYKQKKINQQYQEEPFKSDNEVHYIEENASQMNVQKRMLNPPTVNINSIQNNYGPSGGYRSQPLSPILERQEVNTRQSFGKINQNDKQRHQQQTDYQKVKDSPQNFSIKKKIMEQEYKQSQNIPHSPQNNQVQFINQPNSYQNKKGSSISYQPILSPPQSISGNELSMTNLQKQNAIWNKEKQQAQKIQASSPTTINNNNIVININKILKSQPGEHNPIQEESKEDLAEHETVRTNSRRREENYLPQSDNYQSASESVRTTGNFNQIQYQQTQRQGNNTYFQQPFNKQSPQQQEQQIYSNSQKYKKGGMNSQNQRMEGQIPYPTKQRFKSPGKYLQNVGQLTIKKYSKRRLRSLSPKENAITQSQQYSTDYVSYIQNFQQQLPFTQQQKFLQGNMTGPRHVANYSIDQNQLMNQEQIDYQRQVNRSNILEQMPRGQVYANNGNNSQLRKFKSQNKSYSNSKRFNRR